MKITSFYGGVRYETQLSDLKNGVDILTGTPGRILDFIESGSLDLSTVEHIVLDEVDRMLVNIFLFIFKSKLLIN